MRRFTLSLALLGSVFAAASAAQTADKPQARIASSHGYAKAIELTIGDVRAVLCPEAGGRVLEFSRGGKDAMWFDPAEATRKPGQGERSSAGRFDIGPELTTPRHPKLWTGEWSGEITGECSARLTSQEDEAIGVQLIRDFELTAGQDVAKLTCKQTMINVSKEPRRCVTGAGRSRRAAASA